MRIPRLASQSPAEVLATPRVASSGGLRRSLTLLRPASRGGHAARVKARGGHAASVNGSALRTSAVLAPIVAGADAYVQSDLAATNFGTAATLNNVSGTPEALAYLKFDASGVTGTITKATFRVFTQTSSGSGYALHTVADNSWTETGIELHEQARRGRRSSAPRSTSPPTPGRAWM